MSDLYEMIAQASERLGIEKSALRRRCINGTLEDREGNRPVKRAGVWWIPVGAVPLISSPRSYKHPVRIRKRATLYRRRYRARKRGDEPPALPERDYVQSEEERKKNAEYMREYRKKQREAELVK